MTPPPMLNLVPMMETRETPAKTLPAAAMLVEGARVVAVKEGAVVTPVPPTPIPCWDGSSARSAIRI